MVQTWVYLGKNATQNVINLGYSTINSYYILFYFQYPHSYVTSNLTTNLFEHLTKIYTNRHTGWQTTGEPDTYPSPIPPLGFIKPSYPCKINDHCHLSFYIPTSLHFSSFQMQQDVDGEWQMVMLQTVNLHLLKYI